MEVRSYNHELEIANILFAKLFRNIVIERRIGNDQIKQIPVKCVIGNRSRIFKHLENPDRAATYTLPMIVVTRTGIRTDPNRVSNLHNEIKHQTHYAKLEYNLLTPNPVSIGYTVTIISKEQGINDMILSNFIPFFNQDVFVSSIHPKFTNLKYNSQVVMESSISEDHPSILSPQQDDLVVNTCNFTLKTFLFGGSDSVPARIVGDILDGFDTSIIQKIQLDMHAVPYLDPTTRYETKVFEKTFTVKNPDGTETTETRTISADVAIDDPNSIYSVEKYFQDIELRPELARDVDILRWGGIDISLDSNTLENAGILKAKDEYWNDINVREILAETNQPIDITNTSNQ